MPPSLQQWPLRLAVQDVALSRRKHGFESRWGHQRLRLCTHWFSLIVTVFECGSFAPFSAAVGKPGSPETFSRALPCDFEAGFLWGDICVSWVCLPERRSAEEQLLLFGPAKWKTIQRLQESVSDVCGLPSFEDRGYD